MFFSIQTIALVATLSAGLPTALAGPIEERSTSLCNQQYYGASGYPWQSSSTPGSFCSKTKPSSSKQWKNIPSWDGGDTVRCSTSSGKKNYKVCNGGNSKSSLPSKCNPPHNYPAGWNWGKTSSSSSTKAATSSAAASTSCGSTTTCTAPLCSASYWWSLSCLSPSNWVQTCVSTPKACSGTTSTAAATTFTTTDTSVPSSAAAVISAIVNNGSAVPSSSAVATSLSFVTTYTDSASAAAPTDNSAASTTTTSAAVAATSAAAVDPLQYPVCETTYQVTYQNYTMVAPNGVWAGMTVGSATQDASYMTYTLATTVDDCLAACDQIEGCVFVNTYYDVNDQEADLPKHTPGVLTCSMFSQCVGTDKNDNFGGQDDPNTIVNSNGYCKSGACSS